MSTLRIFSTLCFRSFASANDSRETLIAAVIRRQRRVGGVAGWPRGARFDRLPMREIGELQDGATVASVAAPRLVSLKAASLKCCSLQSIHFPHGEPVEPHTAAMPTGKSAPSGKNYPAHLSTLLKPGLSCCRPSRGNCFRSRSKWEKDRRLRWRVTGPPSGEVPSKGSPAGTMTGACWTSTVRGRQTGWAEILAAGVSDAERTE